MRAQRKGKQHVNNVEHKEKLGCIMTVQMQKQEMMLIVAQMKEGREGRP